MPRSILYIDKKKLLLGVTMVAIFSMCQGQNRTNIWYFGKGAGLDFNTNPPNALVDGKIDTEEGTATICDSLGQILFYTDGVTVWNKNHDTMQNGFGLFGSSSSCQSALIIKKPLNEYIYYILTSDHEGGDRGANYSIVDLRLDNGNGGLIQKNVHLFDDANERIAGTLHKNGHDVWIACTQNYTNKIYIYLLTETGINFHQTETLPAGKADWGVGQLKFSNKGTHLAFGSNRGLRRNNFIMVYDFNTNSGSLANPRSINELKVYGLEFSPNEKYLYFVDYYAVYGEPNQRRLYQCPVDSIRNLSIKKTYTTLIDTTDFKGGSLQLGPDGKIYGTQQKWTSYLYVINQPNSDGQLCDYRSYSMELSGRYCEFGLPNFVQSYIHPEYIEANDFSCSLEPQQIVLHNTEFDSIQWNFGGTMSYTRSNDTIKHQFENVGKHIITATTYLNGSINSIVKDSIIIVDINRDFIGTDTLLCEGDSLQLIVTDATIDSILWNNSTNTMRFVVTEQMRVLALAKNEHCEAKDSINVYFVNCTFNVADTCLADTTKVSHYAVTADSSTINWGVDNSYYRFTGLSQSHLYSRPENYTLTLNHYKNGLSLRKTKSIQITEVATPELGYDILFCDSVLIGPSVIVPHAKYVWNTGSNQPKITVTNSGMYSLEASFNNCSNSDSILLEKDICKCDVFIPNAFSPNNDGINDVFAPNSACILSDYNLKIYNRWGELIFHSSDMNIVWDGYSQNKKAQLGVYFFQLSAHDKNHKLINQAGTFHLLK